MIDGGRFELGNYTRELVQSEQTKQRKVSINKLHGITIQAPYDIVATLQDHLNGLAIKPGATLGTLHTQPKRSPAIVK